MYTTKLKLLYYIKCKLINGLFFENNGFNLMEIKFSFWLYSSLI